MSILSEQIKKLRNANRQSQNEVAKALGKSRETISKYELGEREPGPETIVLLSKHFNVSSDYLLGTANTSEAITGNKQNPCSPELYAFEKYLKDEKFIPYLQLAVRIKDAAINMEQLEAYINSLIKQIKKQKHS